MNSIKQLIHKSTKSSLRRDTRQRAHYITCTLISRLEWQMIYGVAESHFDTVGGRYYFISVFRKKRHCTYVYVYIRYIRASSIVDSSRDARISISSSDSRRTKAVIHLTFPLPDRERQIREKSEHKTEASKVSLSINLSFDKIT